MPGFQVWVSVVDVLAAQLLEKGLLTKATR
jgi:hypothetical protein